MVIRRLLEGRHSKVNSYALSTRLKRLVALGLAGFGILVLAILYFVFGIQTLFYDEEVNEDFAVSLSTEDQLPSEAGDPATSEDAVEPDSVLVRVSSGEFHSVAHPGTGDAYVYRLEDGSHALRLENLDIFNGPALYVYAVASDDANDSDTVLEAGFLDLGPLKGNQGNQTYELPAGFDPARYRAISIWCERFAVNFATAPLR